MEQNKKELILVATLNAPRTKMWGTYNGSVTVARSEWLTDRGHPDKVKAMICLDLVRMRLGILNPSQFTINDYLEVYREPLKQLMGEFGLEYQEQLSWWVTPYAFDLQCETGQIAVEDYSGDFTAWCIKSLLE